MEMWSAVKNPLFLRTKQQIILALRLIILASMAIMACWGQTLSSVPYQVYFAIAVFLINTALVHLRYFSLLDSFKTLAVSFIIDIIAMTLLIYYSGGPEIHRFYLIFLITILITATAHTLIAAFITSFVVSIIYGIMVSQYQVELAASVFSFPFLSKVAFLFTMSTFIGYLSDEAEHERREKEILSVEIKDLTQYFHDVLQSVHSGILVFDNINTITVFNKKAAEILGINSSEVIGKKINETETLSPIYQAQENKDEPSSSYRKEISFRRKDDSFVHIGISFSPLIDSLNNKKGTISIFQDLTLIKKYEAELLAKERLALAGQLSSGLAHDFFNILGGLKKLIEFSRQQKSSPEELQAVLKLTESGLDHSLNIVHNLLAFSRKPLSRLTTTSVAKIIDEVVALVQNEFDKGRIKIIKQISPCPEIKADPTQLHQVLLNLMLNAKKAIASDNGEVCISLKPVDGYLELAVSDNGEGIPPEIKDKIFEPFFTREITGKKISGGIGLGLYVSHEIIKAHSGSINIESKSGYGTEVIVRLPLTK